MILTLEVRGPQAAALGTDRLRTFGPEGGVIGRSKSCTMVLPHDRVSSRHARITCADGAFYIEDTSTNGVFVNDSRERLVRGRPQRLRAGDRLVIDPYEIHVSVSGAAQPGTADPFGGGSYAPSPDPFGGADPFAAGDPFGGADPFADAPSGPPGRRLEPEPGDPGAGELDPLKLLGVPPSAPPQRPIRAARDLEAASLLEGHYQPPAITPPPAAAPPRHQARPETPPVPVIPPDYDPLGPEEPTFPLSGPGTPPPAPPASPAAAPFDLADLDLRDLGLGDLAPTPPPPNAAEVEPLPPDMIAAAPLPPDPGPAIQAPPPPVVPPAPASTGESDEASALAAVLAGAGLTNVAVTPELARDFGRILRVIVTGVMDVLRARQELKDEFRMRTTRFKAADNNPLKFSANVEDALHNLLVKRNAAYLEPVEAFDDAFDDIRSHQLAILAGMRVAFDAMLLQFDASRLQEQFDRQMKRGSILNVAGKLRYWDQYKEWSEGLAKDSEASFRRLFGEAFVRAYEEQLARLDAERRTGRKRDPQS